MSSTKASSGKTPRQVFRTHAQQLEKLAPCQAQCPNSGDIRGWLGIIAQHEKNGLTSDQAGVGEAHRAESSASHIGPYLPAPVRRSLQSSRQGWVCIDKRHGAVYRGLGDISFPEAAGAG